MNDNPHQFTRDAWEANAEVWDERMGDEGNDFFNISMSPTAYVTGGWGEKGSETENYQSHEKRFKNAQSPSRQVHPRMTGHHVSQRNWSQF